MKIEETYCVFLNHELSGHGVIGVFVSERAANDSCNEEREKRKKKLMRGTSKFSKAKLKKHEDTMDNIVNLCVVVMTLDKALDKIRDEAFDCGVWEDTPDASF